VDGSSRHHEKGRRKGGKMQDNKEERGIKRKEKIRSKWVKYNKCKIGKN
jgi:hypothetical protein